MHGAAGARGVLGYTVHMNPWLSNSIDFANQRNYLDELFMFVQQYPKVSGQLMMICGVELKNPLMSETTST